MQWPAHTYPRRPRRAAADCFSPLQTELFPATGNFVLVRFVDSKKVWQAFSENGIIMRDFASKKRLENCIRITIGNVDEMQKTLKTLNSL